jgi:hypothetical protein
MKSMRQCYRALLFDGPTIQDGSQVEMERSLEPMAVPARISMPGLPQADV